LYVVEVAGQVAVLKEGSPDSVIRRTTENARSALSIKIPSR